MVSIAIIKLGAQGDVVRTLFILHSIKKKYPDSEILWITRDNIKEIIERNNQINRVLTLEEAYSLKESFDLIINFDTDEEAGKIMEYLKSKSKKGFGFKEGFPFAYNPGAEYYLNTMFDDYLKKMNKRTYQDIMAEVAELEHLKNPPRIKLSPKDLDYGMNFFKKYNLTERKVIGLHIGASKRWPSKRWNRDCIIKFIENSTKKGYYILLFAGPEEEKEQIEIKDLLKKEGISIILNNPNNTKSEFASLLNLCSYVVCSDSLALHLSIALGKKGVSLFFCTSPHEVETYGLFEKKVSRLLYEFFPEKMNEYSEELTKSISPEEVFEVIEKYEKSC
jgi:heptosyltransferase-2